MVTFIVVATHILNLAAIVAFGWCIVNMIKDSFKDRNGTK
jgi:hypothetical protein